MLRVLFRATAWLVLPLALLLLAQWPLRDVVQAASREANDLAQVIFALYMAVAVTAATLAGSHLAAHAGSGAAAQKPWRRWATVACIAPWAVFLLASFTPQLARSVLQLERFAETLNPGYFVIKAAFALMLILALAALTVEPDSAP